MSIGVSMWLPDCSTAHPTVATLKAAGAAGIMRYLDPGRNDGTEITPQEIADYHANSFPYGLVMEYSADWLEGGYDVGHADALAALAEEAKLGIPHGVIYLACDFQIMPPQYQGALTTMQGFADGYGGWQYVRPYGSKSFCDWVQANSPARGSWSTFAWSENPDGSFSHAADARLWQYNYWPQDVPVVAGCDYNQILGDWAPRNATTTDWFDMASKDDLLTVVRQALNEGTGAGQQNWAATNKALLSTCQSLVNYCHTLVASSNTIISGGNQHKGLDDLATMIEGVGTGTIDPAALEAAVGTAFKAVLAKAAS